MINDLDLVFEEHDDRGRYRRRHAEGSSGRKKKKKRGRSWLALVLTLALLGGLGVGGVVLYDKVKHLFSAPDYDGAGVGGPITIEIKANSVGTDMAKVLKANDIVKSEQAFINAWNDDPKRSASIQPGFYQLKKQMSGESAISALLDKANRVVNGLTIPEGLITLDIYDKLAKALNLKVEDLKKAAADPIKLGVPDWWFKRTDKKAVQKSIEGFLYPDTYEFGPKETAESALRKMVDRFLTVTGDMNFADKVQKDRGISPYEALIAASLVQVEVKGPEMGMAARAIYNRAYAGLLENCKCLQIDATVNYYLRVSGVARKDSSGLTQAELHNKKNPWNTHDFDGLPITPISSPGATALKAAMETPPGKWIYWVVVDKTGKSKFADDWAGHCKNIDEGIRNGVPLDRC